MRLLSRGLLSRGSTEEMELCVILAVLLACTVSANNGTPTLNMCSSMSRNYTNFLLVHNSSDVCSCRLSSEKVYYVNLKRLMSTSPSFISIQTFNATQTYNQNEVDLNNTYHDWIGSDCLFVFRVNQSETLLPKDCQTTSKNGTVTIATYNRTNSKYFSLIVRGKGQVEVNCTTMESNSSNNETTVTGTSSGANVTIVMDGGNSTNTGITNTQATSTAVYRAYQTEGLFGLDPYLVIIISLVLLSLAVVLFIINLVICYTSRKRRKEKCDNQKTPTAELTTELPGWYEDVNEISKDKDGSGQDSGQGGSRQGGSGQDGGQGGSGQDGQLQGLAQRPEQHRNNQYGILSSTSNGGLQDGTGCNLTCLKSAEEKKPTMEGEKDATTPTSTDLQTHACDTDYDVTTSTAQHSCRLSNLTLTSNNAKAADRKKANRLCNGYDKATFKSERDVANIEPELVTSDYDLANIEPERVTSDYDVANIEPERVTSDYDVANIEPEHVTSDYDVANIEPERVTNNYDMAHIEPQHVARKVDMANIEPEGPTSNYNAVNFEPEHATSDYDVAHIEHGQMRYDSAQKAESESSKCESTVAGLDTEVNDLVSHSLADSLDDKDQKHVRGPEQDREAYEYIAVKPESHKDQQTALELKSANGVQEVMQDADKRHGNTSSPPEMDDMYENFPSLSSCPDQPFTGGDDDEIYVNYDVDMDTKPASSTETNAHGLSQNTEKEAEEEEDVYVNYGMTSASSSESILLETDRNNELSPNEDSASKSSVDVNIKMAANKSDAPSSLVSAEKLEPSRGAARTQDEAEPRPNITSTTPTSKSVDMVILTKPSKPLELEVKGFKTDLNTISDVNKPSSPPESIVPNSVDQSHGSELPGTSTDFLLRQTSTSGGVHKKPVQVVLLPGVSPDEIQF